MGGGNNGNYFIRCRSFFLFVHMELGLVQGSLFSVVSSGDGWFSR